MTRLRYAASAAVLSLLAPLGAAVSAAADPGPPTLASITYSGPPYARIGVNQDVATVTLSAPAQGDTTVTVTSDQPMVASVQGGSVTVPHGQSSAAVPVTAFQEGSATLTASMGMTTLPLAPALQVGSFARQPNLSSLTVDPPSVQPDGTATGTVVLDFLGSFGGTSVSLASSNPAVTVPSTVTVTADSDRATFPVVATGTATSDITATLGAVTKTVTFSAADTIPPATTITGLTVKKRAATVRFTASEDGATFRCSLDGGKARACSSPQTYRRLSPGKHRVSVAAMDGIPNVDPSPATRSFRIKR